MTTTDNLDSKSLWRILEVARQLGTPIDLESMFCAVIEAACDVLHAERATVFLYDTETDELWSKAATGTNTVGEIRFNATRGIAGECAQTRELLNIPDCYADSRFNPEIDKKTGFTTRCLLAVPLIAYDNQLVGVLQVLNKIDAAAFSEQDLRIAQTLAAQCAVALQRAQLIEETIEKQRMQRDLAIAQEIQLNVLPDTMPTLPGYDLAGWTESADETGGDIYDAVQLAPHIAMILLGDATGHGIGPALSVTQCRAMFRMAIRLDASLDDMFMRTNEQLTEDLSDNRFITAFFGHLNAKTHTLRYHAGGQGPLVHFHAHDRTSSMIDASTFPMGITADTLLEVPPDIHLMPGDIFALLSDGYFEYLDPDNKQFGGQRVAEAFAQYDHLPASEIIIELNKAVERFSRGEPQLDDMTALLIKRLPD